MVKINYKDITIIESDILSENMRQIDESVSADAFSYLANLSEEEKVDSKDKYKVNAWKYLHAKYKEEIVGRVVLDRRNIMIDDKENVVVGIGGLAIRKKYQKLGIGKHLMCEITKLCKRNNIDFIFLNAGGKLQDYYKGFGFKLHDYSFSGISGKKYTEDEGMVLVLNENIELKAQMFDIGVGNV